MTPILPPPNVAHGSASGFDFIGLAKSVDLVTRKTGVPSESIHKDPSCVGKWLVADQLPDATIRPQLRRRGPWTDRMM
jgi:hypothetical protein